MLAVYKAGQFSRKDEQEFWGPMIAEVERLRGVPGSSSDAIVADEDFEMDNSQDPDFEPGSDAESGEGGDGGGTDVELDEAAQGEGETGPV